MGKWHWPLIAGVALLLAACAAAATPPEQVAERPGLEADKGVAPADTAVRRAAPAPAGAAPPGAPAPKEEAAQAWDRMIIRNAKLTLVVKDVEESIAAVRDLAQAMGGYVVQSNTRYQGDQMLADLSLQVPSTTFDQTVQNLRRLAVRVETETSSSQDVTEEYTDLDSQLRNLQATEAGLLRLMEKADKIADILAIQKELTSVRGQIERVQGRLKFLSRRAEMSTISVSLIPESKAKKPPPSNFGDTVLKAWGESLGLLAAVATGIALVIAYLWWLLIPLGVGGWLAWRRWGRR